MFMSLLSLVLIPLPALLALLLITFLFPHEKEDLNIKKRI